MTPEELAKLLLGLIKERKPDFKERNMPEWIKHIDWMIRIDRRKPERIEEVIRWCQNNDFWQNNILSTKKLRFQFDQLELRMASDKRIRQVEKPKIRLCSCGKPATIIINGEGAWCSECKAEQRKQQRKAWIR